MHKLFIFDCDGTLVDSQHLIVGAMSSAFIANNMPVPPRAKLVRSIGLSLTEAMSTLANGASEEMINKLAVAYRSASLEMRRKAMHPDPMFPGAREAVEALARQEDVFLGIATGKSRRGVYLFLEREGLRKAFATVQTADDAPSKPHPAMIRQAMAAVGARPENTVMIGDTSFDMQMARAAGVRGVGVNWGYHAPNALTKAGASTVATDFSGLVSLLLSLKRMNAVA